MAWTTPRTWVSGELVTAALMNTHVRDNQLAIFPSGDSWTTVAHGSLTFSTSGGGTWTVELADLAFYKYRLTGKSCKVQFVIQNSTLASSPGILRITPPPGITIAGQAAGCCVGTMNGVISSGGFALQTNAGISNHIFITLASGTGAFTNGTNNCTFWGEIEFQTT